MLDIFFKPEEIIEKYKKTKEVISWPVEPELRNMENAAVKYRNIFARQMADEKVSNILKSYLNIFESDMDELIWIAYQYVLTEPLKGIGMELGAGCALLSATLCKSSQIEAILAIELCAEMSRLIIPKVSSAILGKDYKKIVPIIGSFNILSIEDKSIDFIVEVGSLHHSDNLERTLKESFRVLKPGGKLLCFDRCQPDSMTDHEIEKKLNVKYSKEFLVRHGYPPHIYLTRRENGEHEYRYFEWKNAFDAAGFTLEKCIELLSVDIRRAIRGVLSIFPTCIKKRLYNTEDADLKITYFWLKNIFRIKPNRRKWREKIPSPKNATLIYLTKPLLK